MLSEEFYLAVIDNNERGISRAVDELYPGLVSYLMSTMGCCEDDCQEPPVEVTYKYGIDVPALGELAMGELACEILAGLRGLDCRLPSNAVSVTRQGITVDLGDASTLYNEHRIGLPLCDAFIRDANPNRLKMQSSVHSPDLTRRVR
jgi:hypothetical protein